MSNALSHLKTSELDEKRCVLKSLMHPFTGLKPLTNSYIFSQHFVTSPRYNINLDRYSKVVSKIHALEAVGDGVITRLPHPSFSRALFSLHPPPAPPDSSSLRLHEAGLKLAAVAQRYMMALPPRSACPPPQPPLPIIGPSLRLMLNQASSAKKPNAQAVAKLKKSLDAAQEAVAQLTQEQVLADTDVQKVKLRHHSSRTLVQNTTDFSFRPSC